MGYSVQYSHSPPPIRDRRRMLLNMYEFLKIGVWKAVLLLRISMGLHLALYCQTVWAGIAQSV